MIINKDSLEYMKTVPDKYYDIIITSPPYNMNLRLNKKNDGYISRQIVKEISNKYENYTDNLPMDQYYQFLYDNLKEMLRISNLIFFNIQMITGNKPALFKLLGEFNKDIKEVIIWNKINAQPAISNKVLNSQFEFIYVLGDKPISRMFTHANFNRGELSNVWNIKTTRSKIKGHGATFPEELIEKIIMNFAKSGDKILDPFLGTGTTGIVCNRLGYEWDGIELSREYCEIAEKLINATY